MSAAVHSASRVPDAIAAFLHAPTPRAWVTAAADDVALLLNDHANCEYKAAATALSLIARYTEDAPLVERMSRLAREELRHFEQVRALMHGEGVAWRRLTASRYAGGLRALVRAAEPGRRLDLLVVGAYIEARSCERFALLVPRLPAPVADFYARLLASEARHFQDYLALAAERDEAGELDVRIARIGEAEATLAIAPDAQLRFHSGPPVHS